MVEIGDSDRLDDPNLQLYLCRWKHGWWGRWCLKRAAWNGSKLRLVEDRARGEVDEVVNASPKYGNHGVSRCFLSFGDANLRCQERWVLFGNPMDPTCHDSFENMGAKATATPDQNRMKLWTTQSPGPGSGLGCHGHHRRSQVFISWVSWCSCSLLLHLCKSVLCWTSYSHAVWDFVCVCVFFGLGVRLEGGATKHKVTTYYNILLVCCMACPPQDRPADASGPAVAPP